VIPEQASAAESRLEITRVEAGGTVRLVLVGELDAIEEPTLIEAVAETLRRAPGRPIGVDAAGLTYLDSRGIRTLLACHQLAENAGSRFSIVDAGAIAYEVLRITSLLHLFDVVAPRPSSSRPAPGDSDAAGSG
jgi:anti-sigma B factor antagonist